jgi:hypothetical protein
MIRWHSAVTTMIGNRGVKTFGTEKEPLTLEESIEGVVDKASNCFTPTWVPLVDVESIC